MISTYDKVWIENKNIHEIKKYAQIYLLYKMYVLFQTTCILSFLIKLIHGCYIVYTYVTNGTVYVL